jgi:hypothetical protein
MTVTEKAKHTPGPWELRGLSDHVRVEHKTGVVSRINVARCGSSKPGPSEPRSHDEVWANARLIAAAPELLEALKKFVDLVIADHDAQTDRYYFEAEKLASIAIRKALETS